MLEFLLSIAYIIGFCLLITKLKFFKDEIIPRHWFISLFGIKIIASIILTAIYTHYYTDRDMADIYKYFDDSLFMFEAIKTNLADYFKMLFAIDNDSAYFTSNYYKQMSHWVRPYSNDFFSDTHVIIRFNAFVRLFSFGNFQVHNVFINFVSLLGLTAIYKAFKPFLLNKEKLLFYCLTLIPSLLFWGSGLLKESIIFFALGFSMLHFFKITSRFKLHSLLVILVCLLIIVYTKFYLLIALSIPLFGYVISLLFGKRKILGYLISAIVLIGIGFLLPLVNQNWDIISQIASKQQTFSRFILHVPTNSGFIIPTLTDASSIFSNIPNALLNTLIRPYPWECKTPFVWLSLLENIMVITSIIIAVIFRTKKWFLNNTIFYFTILFASSLFILIGLTTPVFGAIVRYKIPAVLFLLIGLLTVLDIDKLKTKAKWLNRIL